MSVNEQAKATFSSGLAGMDPEGTNTWLLAEPGSSLAVVVDPGPDVAAHHEAVLDAADSLGSQSASSCSPTAIPTTPRGPRPWPTSRARCLSGPWTRLTGSARRGSATATG